MSKKYVASSFLKLQDSHVYTIFAWSEKPAEIVPKKSWLTAMEIFVHEHSISQAYAIFEKIMLAAIVSKVTVEMEKYQNLLQDAIVLLSDGKVTIFGKGFRSFIEKDLQFELGALSSETYQVLPQLFSQAELVNDLAEIDSLEKFSNLVNKLANLGLLSPAPGTIDWGDLKKTVPICQAFGLTRGTPVDRYYLSKFIAETGHQVVGKILEIGGTPKDKDFYEFNPDTSYQVLNMEAGLGVDIVGDVHDSSLIDADTFDSIIIFNVLEHCYAPSIAVENIYKWLKSGGKCFAMVPSSIRTHATPKDYWRPLPDGFTWIFRDFSQQKLYVYGNPTTVIASYHGIAVEELTSEELDAFHPDYPVATCIMAEK